MRPSTNPVSELATGAGFALRGFRLLGDPALRGLVIVPIIINVVLIVGLVSLFGWQLDHWLDAWLAALPGWLAWLENVLWWLAVLLAFVLFALVFTLLANLVASPFNPYLSARVESHYGRGAPASDSGLAGEIAEAIGGELRRLAWYASRALLLLVITFALGFVPIANLAVAPLWFCFGALMLAFEYLDQPLGNRGLAFETKKAYLCARFWRHLGFGAAVTGLTLLPLANLVVMPAAVIGATLMYIATADSQRLPGHAARSMTTRGR